MENASYLLEKDLDLWHLQIMQKWKKEGSLCIYSRFLFVNCFAGDIYDVSEGGKHPVYRYAKPILWGYHYEGLFKTLPGENMYYPQSI